MFSEKEVKMNNVKEILKKGRKILLLRLMGLNNPYHNKEHIQNVVKYLKILLKNLKSDFFTEEEVIDLLQNSEHPLFIRAETSQISEYYLWIR